VITFQPMGMVFGLVLAKQRNVENPLVPALVSGMLPMPMGIVASLLLIDRQSNEATSTTSPAPQEPKPQIGEALDAYQHAIKATPLDLNAVSAAVQQVLKLWVVVRSLGESVIRDKLKDDFARLPELKNLVEELAKDSMVSPQTGVPMPPPPSPAPTDSPAIQPTA
jgi:hypothetical protein